jgi:hypothetical protein
MHQQCTLFAYAAGGLQFKYARCRQCNNNALYLHLLQVACSSNMHAAGSVHKN